MGLGMEIGIDLGTSSVLIYVRGKGVVLKEPSVVAVNTKTGKVLAVGESASLMLGRTPGVVEAIRPLREGVISDFRATEVMLKAFIGRVCSGFRATYFKPTIVVCVPSVITPGGDAISLSNESTVVVFPAPVSPTSPSVFCCLSARSIPFTA